MRGDEGRCGEIIGGGDELAHALSGGDHGRSWEMTGDERRWPPAHTPVKKSAETPLRSCATLSWPV